MLDIASDLLVAAFGNFIGGSIAMLQQNNIILVKRVLYHLMDDMELFIIKFSYTLHFYIYFEPINQLI